MLPGEKVIAGIKQDALNAARVLDDGAARLPAVRAIDYQSPDGICAEIYAKGEGHDGSGKNFDSETPRRQFDSVTS